MSRPRLASSLLAVAVLAACDLPTEAPIIDQRWILPVEQTSVGVADLLPDRVSELPEGFRVSLDPTTSGTTLGQACTACAAANGTTVPKPPFTTVITVSQDLPDRVTTVVLGDTDVEVTLANGFNFDPIRPGGTTGSITLTIRNGEGGAVLGQTVLNGTVRALPPGSSTTETLTLNGTLTGPLHASVDVTSPLGDPVTIDASGRLDVTASSDNLVVGAVTADVSGEDLTIDPVDLDAEDLDREAVDRIQEGRILLEVTNPFDVRADGQVTIEFPGGRISKSLTIGPGVSDVALSYTGDELRTFLGVAGSTLTGGLTVSPDAGSVTLQPGQRVAFVTRIDLTIRIGG
ncbi:MAG: hypothetical protein RH859_01445 [Longimicrobiales bacterium]